MAATAEVTGWTYWIVPHTHWDREWYLTVEDFQVKLGQTLDEIVDVVGWEPAFRFTLDGQSVLLEDYRAIRGGHWPRLARLIAEGQVTVGPSYVLGDEFLMGQEALVRNLLIGRETCWDLGVRPAALGYVPDTFGHVNQLPQILAGFGLDNALFTRGQGDEEPSLGAVFRWRAPDGTSVLAIPQLDGYMSGRRLGHEKGKPPGPLEERTRRALDRLTALTEKHRARLELSELRDVLICAGGDHVPIQRDLPSIIRRAAAEAPEHHFLIATFEDYVAELRSLTSELPEYEGELLGARSWHVLRGVNSTRMWIKQANEECERELLTAEALATLAMAAGCQPYPSGELRLAWRELLKNHPHDSICGCSVDEVHEAMEPRFDRVARTARRVQQIALAALADAAPDWLQAAPGPIIVVGSSGAFSLANPLPWRRRRLLEMRLPADSRGVPSALVDERGGRVPVQHLGDGTAVALAEVDGFAGTTLRLVPDDEEPAPPAQGESAIENDVYRVVAHADGSLAVTHLPTGATVDGVHVLEDCGDRGDEYTFCGVHDRSWTSRGGDAEVRVTEHGPAVSELEVSLVARLPKRLAEGRDSRTEERVDCPIRTRVRIAAGVDRVEFTTVVENLAEDHRLRVGFPAGDTATALAEAPYALVERPARRVPQSDWMEEPPATEHMLGAVKAGPTTVLARGLPEYELDAAEGGSLVWLTLLRCVGWLNRDDLPIRGHAGPSVATPGAQCLGRHRFEYAMTLADLRGSAIVRASQDYRFGFVAGPPGIDMGRPIGVRGGACFGALKGADDGEGAVLRLYNPGAEPVPIDVEGTFDLASPSRLDETVAEAIAVGRTELRPGEIVTLRLLGRLEQIERTPQRGEPWSV
jgi:mannosylglycerate hydrolase